MTAPAIVARREIRDTLSDWRVLLPMLVLAILFPAIIVAGIRLGLPLLDRIDPEATADKIIPFGAMIAAFFPISFSLVVALESFVGEKERNTLEALLVMPMSDTELFLGKFLAVIIPPAALATLGLTVFTAGLWIAMRTVPPPDFLVLALLLSLVKALAMVAGAIVVSSQTTSVRASNLLASFIILPMALVMQGEVLLVLTGRGGMLWLTFAALAAVALILLRMGIGVFNREEILARESDAIRLSRIRDLLVTFWRDSPRALRHPESARPATTAPWPVRLYIRHIPELLALHRTKLALTAGFFTLWGALGVALALRYPVPFEVVPEGGRLSEEAIRRALEGFGPLEIFVHNAEIVLITAALAGITFGVTPILILGLPFAVIGFLAGQAAQHDVEVWRFLVAFFAPHGLFEIPALLLAAAFGLNIGLTLMAPPRHLGFGGGLLLAVVEWIKMAWLFFPLFLLAGVVEVMLTPRVVAALFGG